MLSQGYCAAQNRPGLLIETHMLKPYKPRVEATYSMIRLTIELLNRDNKKLKKLEQDADLASSSPAFRKNRMPVGFTESFSDSSMVDFKGVEYTMDTSDLTGGLWFRYDNSKPVTWKIPMFSNNRATAEVQLPEAYIIPPEWVTVIERLKLHQIRMQVLQKPVKVNATILHFSNVKWQQRSYEGRHKVTYDLIDSAEVREYPAGSVVVDMNQRAARVIAFLLEPESPDSYVAWGFFDAVLEQKEYVESYVMEPEARKMLADNPGLKAEFEKKKAADPKFASNSDAILNWFYSRTPWWDSHYNVYPVAKIMDRKVVDEILK
jgi:hypothetical protein